MTRDPRTDPREGDELRERGGDHVIIVDMVKTLTGEPVMVYYRVLDGQRTLVKLRRIPIVRWTQMTTKECEAPHD